MLRHFLLDSTAFIFMFQTISAAILSLFKQKLNASLQINNKKMKFFKAKD